MPKQLLFDQEARAALLRGVNIMSHAVKVTLGPKGRNVVIAKKVGSYAAATEGAAGARGIAEDDSDQGGGGKVIDDGAATSSDVPADGAFTAEVVARGIPVVVAVRLPATSEVLAAT